MSATTIMNSEFKQTNKMEKNIQKKKKFVRNKKKNVLKFIPKDSVKKLYTSFCRDIKTIYEEEEILDSYLGRIPNFPEKISENLVIFALQNKNMEADWRTKSGDLKYYKNDVWKKGEVKCRQNGPSQFSPSSKWNTLFYINAENHLYGDIEIFMIENISSINLDNIKVSKSQTFKEQTMQGRRPRFNIQTILKEHLNADNMIYNGTINDLLH